MLRDHLFQMIDGIGIPEQVQLIQTSANSTLDPSKRVAGQQLFHPLQTDHGLLGHVREALPQGGRLGGNIVGAGNHHQINMG